MAVWRMRMCIAVLLCTLAMIAAGCSQKASDTAADDAASPNAASASQAANAPATNEAETPSENLLEVRMACFKVVFPEELVSDLEFVQENPYSLSVRKGDIVVFSIICPQAYEYHGSEHKFCKYKLGTASDGGAEYQVHLEFPYITNDHEHNAHWGDKSANELAISVLTPLTLDDVFDAVSLRTAQTDNVSGEALWVACTPELTADDGNAAEQAQGASTDADATISETGSTATGSSSADLAPSDPFWGVWVTGTQDQIEAEAFVERARAAGWQDAQVYVTTDWDNLNTEKWYVVSLQRCSTQDEAEEAASRAQQAGYDGAYAKYTGTYIGN